MSGILQREEAQSLLYKISSSLLCAVPSGKPTITAAHNASSTSIQLTWRPPHPSTIHGEFLGYRSVSTCCNFNRRTSRTFRLKKITYFHFRIIYKPRDSATDDATEITVKDPSMVKFTIQKLDIFTQYLVSLQVVNPEGLGPSTTVVVMTDEGGKYLAGLG